MLFLFIKQPGSVVPLSDEPVFPHFGNQLEFIAFTAKRDIGS
jgi:hypothetical protein